MKKCNFSNLLQTDLENDLFFSYLGSLGATLPPEPEKSEAPKSEPKKEETPVEDEPEPEPESEESDVELDLTGVIEPDTGKYIRKSLRNLLST